LQKGESEMKSNQLGLPACGILTLSLWIAVLLVLPLILPAQAQASDVKPVPVDATMAGGAVTVRAPIGEYLRAAGGDVHIELRPRAKLGGAL
jgi:hypothetical protein